MCGRTECSGVSLNIIISPCRQELTQIDWTRLARANVQPIGKDYYAWHMSTDQRTRPSKMDGTNLLEQMEKSVQMVSSREQ